MTISLLDPNIFAFGGDSNPLPEINTDVPKRKVKPPEAGDNDDDDQDDNDDHIEDPRDRRIAKLSRESNRRRIAVRNIKAELAEKEAEIEDLRKELDKVPKLQKAYQDLETKRNTEQETLKRMAIKSAIENDKDEEGNSRSWYDISMVQGLLDNDQLAVDLSDFSVGGITEQLSAIAAERPFLVKRREDNGSRQQQTQNPSGSAPQSSATGNRSQEAASNENKMRAEFPALQGLI